MNTEKIFNEVIYRFSSLGLATGTVSDDHLPVLLDGTELCLINDEGSILYPERRYLCVTYATAEIVKINYTFSIKKLLQNISITRIYDIIMSIMRR